MKSLRIITVITVILVLGSHIIQGQPNHRHSNKSHNLDTDTGSNESKLKKEPKLPGLTDTDPLDLSKDDFATPKSFEQHKTENSGLPDQDDLRQPNEDKVKSKEPMFPALTYRDPADMSKDDFNAPKSFEPHSAQATDLPDLDDSHQRSDDALAWIKYFFGAAKAFEQHSVQTTGLPDIDDLRQSYEDKVKSKEPKFPGLTDTDPLDLPKDATSYDGFLPSTEAASSGLPTAIESFNSTYLTAFSEYIKKAAAVLIIIYSVISNVIPLFFHVINYLFGKDDSNVAGMGSEEIKRPALADAADYVRSAIRKYKDMQKDVTDYEEYE